MELAPIPNAPVIPITLSVSAHPFIMDRRIAVIVAHGFGIQWWQRSTIGKFIRLKFAAKGKPVIWRFIEMYLSDFTTQILAGVILIVLPLMLRNMWREVSAAKKPAKRK
jgi:hypothetical protein